MKNAADVVKPICSVDPTRVNINAPFGTYYEGRRWVVGTDGHCMVMVPGDHPDRDGAPDIAKVFAPEPPPLAYRASVSALREWTGPAPRPPAWAKCERCDGEGEIECPTCGADDYDCPDCGGAGELGELPEVRCGALLSGCLNKTLLARVLSTLPADVTDIRLGQRGDSDIYFMRAQDWIGVVMPLKYGNPKSRFEALEAVSP